MIGAATPEISVAISTMDRPDTLGPCLAAIWGGSVRPREIIVVDQSLDDATERLVHGQRATGLPIRYERTQVRGLGASQNIAISLASCSIVAVTDDDCIIDGHWLAVIGATFSANPDLDLVAGRVLPLPAAGDRVWPVSSRTSTRRVDFRGYAAPWDIGSGNNFAVRREAYLHIGGCDERLGPGSPGKGGVDMDLFYRLVRSGGTARYEPDSIVYHERQTLEGRLGRRPLYGHGTGACCALRYRDGDPYALRMLTYWIWLRLRVLMRAMLHGDRQTLGEEMVMLRTTVSGVRHGWRVWTPNILLADSANLRDRSGSAH